MGGHVALTSHAKAKITVEDDDDTFFDRTGEIEAKRKVTKSTRALYRKKCRLYNIRTVCLT